MATEQLSTQSRHTWTPWLAVVLWTLISFSQLGAWLESSLIRHVLVQIPLLVLVGILLGDHYRVFIASWWQSWNGGGIAGILIASFTLAFWMIPRWLDASLTETVVATSKYVSIPLLVGLPLAMSWARMHSITRAVVKIEFLTMLFRLGWLYLISPNRLCNNYLLDEQVWLGQGFILVAVSLSISWLIPVFFGSYAEAKINRAT